MKKLLTTLLLLSLFMGFTQSNDDIRGGSKRKKTNTSGSGNSGSSGGGGSLSSNDIALIIDACGCLYDVGLVFITEVFVKGIQANTRLIEARRDSLPRIKNMELNLGYGFYPDDFAYFTPKIRLQAGVIGTSFRAWARQDRSNPFATNLLSFFDWQILEFNIINRKNYSLRTGMGFMTDPTSRNGDGVWDGDDLSFYPEITAGTDIFFFNERLRWNLEGRYTPFGEVKPRREASTRFYLRPSDRQPFRPEVFVGGTYTQLFDVPAFGFVEAGVGFMLY